MKRIEDIEKMEISELEKIAMDENTSVPSDLGQQTSELLDSLELSEKILGTTELSGKAIETDELSGKAIEAAEVSGKAQIEGTGSNVRPFKTSRWIGSSNRIFRLTSVAAAIAVLVGIGLSLNGGLLRPSEKELVDTFDDPALAYAQLEKAMLKIGGGLQKGIASVELGNECIETPVEIINQSLK